VETNDLMSGIAQSWEVSDDGVVFTFHLIQKVPWVRYNPDKDEVEIVMMNQVTPVMWLHRILSMDLHVP